MFIKILEKGEIEVDIAAVGYMHEELVQGHYFPKVYFELLKFIVSCFLYEDTLIVLSLFQGSRHDWYSISWLLSLPVLPH